MQFVFQGLAFTTTERQILGINGHLPPAVKTDEEQIAQAIAQLNRYEKDIDKYVYLNGLHVSCITNIIQKIPRLT